jgi:hypothetical protein
MYFLISFLLYCYPNIQRILNAWLHNCLYYASCPLYYIRWRCKWIKSLRIPTAISNPSKRQITQFKNIFTLVMEKHLSRSFNYVTYFLALLKLIHWNRHNNLYSLNSFLTSKHKHRPNKNEQNRLCKSSFNFNRIFPLYLASKRLNRRIRNRFRIC